MEKAAYFGWLRKVGAPLMTSRGKEANNGGVETIDSHHGWRGGWLVTYDT